MGDRPSEGSDRRPRSGKGSRTDPVIVNPPEFVPLSEEDERTAIRALTELLADQETSQDTVEDAERDDGNTG
jgi:hypothetical protein